MAIPSSGPVSFEDLKNEYNDTDPVELDEFYRGDLVPNSAINNGNVPTSGSLSLEDLRGSSNEYVAEVTTSTTQLDLQTLFTAAAWSSAVPKRVEIPSGVVIGSADTATPALTISGAIRGAGGSANSGNGGPAVTANSTSEIQNTGEIYAGGGGGGRGGTGGTGSCSPTPGSPTPCPCGPGNLRCEGGSCPCGGGSSQCCCQAVGGLPQCRVVCCRPSGCTNPPSGNPNVSGGVGGDGGQGRGFVQAANPGSAGSAGPTCSGPSGSTGGAGGTGGTGGDWGTDGDVGGTGSNGNLGSGGAGVAGGTAGNYIINDSNVTWIGPRGTVAGGVA